jgi:hypothetical protein
MLQLGLAAAALLLLLLLFSRIVADRGGDSSP